MSAMKAETYLNSTLREDLKLIK